MIKLDFDQLLSPTSKTLTTMADQDNLPPFQFMPRSMERDFEKREKLREIYQYVRLITKQDASRTTLTQVYSRNSFTKAVSIVFAPATQAIITAGNLRVSSRLQHLYDYLLENQHIQPLRDYHPEHLTTFSRDVYRRMQEGDPSWVHDVPPGVAFLICQRHLLGFDPAKFEEGATPCSSN